MLRWVLSIDAKRAVCVSIVNSVQSSLHQISSVYGATSGATPLLKFMTGVHLSQDFDRIAGLCGMVFDLDLMHMQLNMSALIFGTKGIPINKYGELIVCDGAWRLNRSQRNLTPQTRRVSRAPLVFIANRPTPRPPIRSIMTTKVCQLTPFPSQYKLTSHVFSTSIRREIHRVRCVCRH